MNGHGPTDTPLRQLSRLGQSVWIDWLSRDLLESGELQRLIAEHAVVGVTTNPTILEQAIAAAGGVYDRQICDLRGFGLEPAEIFAEFAATDVSNAAVQLLPVWQATGGADGYVSWEVDPALAWNPGATVSEVRRLARRIDLPNLLVKIPATEPGLVAIEDSIAAGYSINVTLIFSLERYSAVAEAYLRGLRRADAYGLDLSKIHSVASFFVSRLDTAVDELLHGQKSPLTTASRGRLGIASAKLVYRHFRAVFSGRRWEALRARGATPQRPLWASTSSKDAAYRDVRYVENLIGPETVTTLPKTTLEAFEDHGQVRETLGREVEEARLTLADLLAFGVDLNRLTDKLERDGISRFGDSVERVLQLIESRGQRALAA
jgi:transaldolase